MIRAFRTPSGLASLFAATLSISGCSELLDANRRQCEVTADCAAAGYPGLMCVEGLCVATRADAAVDAARDAGENDQDAGQDAGVDAGPPDAGYDWGTDPLNTNGGFELGSMDGWACAGPETTCALTMDDPHSGDFALRATNFSEDWHGVRVELLPLVCPSDITCQTGPDARGRLLRFRAFIKNIGPATMIRMIVRYNCGKGMEDFRWIDPHTAPTPGVWNEYQGTFRIPEDCNLQADKENLYWYVGHQGLTEFHIDDLSITVVDE